MSFYGSIRFIFDFINLFRVNWFLPKMEVNDNIYFYIKSMYFIIHGFNSIFILNEFLISVKFFITRNMKLELDVRSLP